MILLIIYRQSAQYGSRAKNNNKSDLFHSLKLFHLNFNSLQICFVLQAEACHTHQVNLNIRAHRCLGYTIYMFDVIVVTLNGLYYIAINKLFIALEEFVAMSTFR